MYFTPNKFKFIFALHAYLFRIRNSGWDLNKSWKRSGAYSTIDYWIDAAVVAYVHIVLNAIVTIQYNFPWMYWELIVNAVPFLVKQP